MPRISIDVAAEGCCWEGEECDRPGYGILDTGCWAIYCREHCRAWKAELARQAERDRPKLPGMQDWWRRMNAARRSEGAG